MSGHRYLERPHHERGLIHGNPQLARSVGEADGANPLVLLDQAHQGALHRPPGRGYRHIECLQTERCGGQVCDIEGLRNPGPELHGGIGEEVVHLEVVLSTAPAPVVDVELRKGVHGHASQRVEGLVVKGIEHAPLKHIVLVPIRTVRGAPESDGGLANPRLPIALRLADRRGRTCVAEHEGGHVAVGEGPYLGLAKGGAGPAGRGSMARVDHQGPAVVDRGQNVGPAGPVGDRIELVRGVSARVHVIVDAIIVGSLGHVEIGSVVRADEGRLLEPSRCPGFPLLIGEEASGHFGRLGLVRHGDASEPDIGEVIRAAQGGVIEVGRVPGVGIACGGRDVPGVAREKHIAQRRLGP